ncbi:MAG: 30S ribosomal protein S9 [Candidatus Bathyarchaeia archaeon]|nr:30S ribosomal protein S9 [Candidatus Bathyarchaeota archaeon]
MVISGKRKTSIAKAIFRSGSGHITFNNLPLNILSPELARVKILEPIILAADKAKGLDIEIKASGGGIMGQADAARTAIAKGLVKWTKSAHVKRLFRIHDRAMLAGDPRRSESKKFGGPGARRRRQKSYR